MSNKKGDLLNQLAIISDLIEKANLESVRSSVLIEVNDKEFERIKNYISTKQKLEEEKDEPMFAIVMGDVDFVFSKNSV